MTESFLSQYAQDLLAIVADPRKRLFAGYLLAAALIGLVVLTLRHRDGLRASLCRLLARRVWWSESARADYKLLLVNQALMAGLAPALLAQATVATAVFYALHDAGLAAPGFGAAAPGWAVAGAFTLTLFVLDDLTRYGLHRLLHRVPALWAFHKVHHGARTLTPLTVYRIHPVEGVLFALRATVVQAAVIAAFFFAFGDRVDLVAVLGANVALFAFNALGSNLRHSHVAFGYGERLEHLLISPAQHQLHHSSDPRHFDCNFGAALALWDWLGGTLRTSRRGQRLRFGLARRAAPGEQRLAHLYLAPFAEAAALARHGLRRAFDRLRGLRVPLPEAGPGTPPSLHGRQA